MPCEKIELLKDLINNSDNIVFLEEQVFLQRVVSLTFAAKTDFITKNLSFRLSTF